MERHGRLDQGVCKCTGAGFLMAKHMPFDEVPDPAMMSAAVSLVLSRGGPADDDTDDAMLIQRVCGQVPSAPERTCRDAVVRAKKLSQDAYTVCDAFRVGSYGSGNEAVEAAIRELQEKNPGFSGADYRQAFAAGLMWTAF